MLARICQVSDKGKFMADFTRFTAPLWIEYAHKESELLGRDLWRVVREFRYYLSNSKRCWITVPRGYLIDGASVPRLLWSIIPPWGAYGQATTVHDILCEYLIVVVDGRPVKITREAADYILADALIVTGVPEDQRRKINIAVEAYRKLSRQKDPVWHKAKAALEARWVADNPI